MPELNAIQKQEPMEATTPEDVVITRQPNSEPQIEVSLRGGFKEECGYCRCKESYSCCGSDEHKGPPGGGPPGGGPPGGGPGYGGPGGPGGRSPWALKKK